jgi:hypothetical protein
MLSNLLLHTLFKAHFPLYRNIKRSYECVQDTGKCIIWEGPVVCFKVSQEFVYCALGKTEVLPD